MKAMVQDRYGSPDVLEFREIDEPVAADDEVLVRVRAASVHPDVWHVMRGVPYVLRIWEPGSARRRTVFRARTWPGTSSRSARR
jgi:NADPH:quinone reductase-like Zn-dependent oxidoreductase